MPKELKAECSRWRRAAGECLQLGIRGRSEKEPGTDTDDRKQFDKPLKFILKDVCQAAEIK